MTVTTEKNQLIGQADESQTPLNKFTSRSADLEKIINSLGHAVGENQIANSEPSQGLATDSINSDGQSVGAQSDAACDEPDIFGALEDQMSDVMPSPAQTTADVSECATSEADVVAGVEEGDLDNLSDWNQSMANELSRIYSEIDGDEAVDTELSFPVAEQAVNDQPIVEPVLAEPAVGDVEIGNIFENDPLAGLNLDDVIVADDVDAGVEVVSDDAEVDAAHGSSALDEELLDTEYLAAALQAVEDTPNDVEIDDVQMDDVQIDEDPRNEQLQDAEPQNDDPQNEDPQNEVQLAEIAADAGDEVAAASALDSADTSAPMSPENRLEDIASRIEEIIGGKSDFSAMKTIEMRFDHLEEKLNAVIEYPETDAGLFALEAQMNDLKEQFQQVEAQLVGIAGIENNVNALMDEVKSSKSMLNTVAAGIAGTAVGSLSAGDGDKSDRLAELGDILEDYIKERRETDQYAAGAFSDIQSGLDDIAHYLVENNPAYHGEPQLEAQFVAPTIDAVEATDAAEDVDPIEKNPSEPADTVAQASEQAEEPAVFAHGSAQEALGQKLDVQDGNAHDEESHDEDAQDAGVENTGSEDYLDEIAAGLEIGAEEDLDAEAMIDTSIEALDVVEDGVEVQASTSQLVDAQIDAGQRQYMAEARQAEEVARAQAATNAVQANEADRAGNFLASARKAAIVAAAQAETQRVDEMEKKGKKKRSLFSFKFGGASPVLIVATTILSATTAGMVYSKIKDNPVQLDIARSLTPALEKVFTEPTNTSSRKSSLIAVEKVASEERFVINDVPHRRDAGTNGVDVPVGIIIKDPQTKPGLKQLAAMKRRQQLAKMSSDLTGEVPLVAATNIAFAPEGDLESAKPNVAKNTGPTLALPPASIGPFSLRVAAAKGDAGSQFSVATRYAQGRGVKRNFKLAAKWYGRAAAQGHAIAQYRLAALYEKGSGVGRDGSRAQTWYRRSAEKGNVKAMHNLAVLHTGRGGKAADYTTAAQWFSSAAERGLPDSQYNLAILYANGLGVKRSKTEAYKWFGLASAGGDREAGKRQTALKSAMSGVEVKAAKRLLVIWQEKPTIKSANEPHQAALVLKKSNISGDQNKVRLVRQAQSMLGRLGYSAGVADGRMGPKTRDAIRNFQKRSGMKVTGDVSSALISKLSSLAG